LVTELVGAIQSRRFAIPIYREDESSAVRMAAAAGIPVDVGLRSEAGVFCGKASQACVYGLTF